MPDVEKWSAALAAAAALGATAIALAARGDELGAGPAPFYCGAQQFGLLVGGGFGIPMFANPDDRESRTRVFGVFGRWGIGLTDPILRDGVLEGNVEVHVEPMVLLNFHPRDGWAAGGSLLLHYNF